MPTEEKNPSLKRVFNGALLIRAVGTVIYISIFLWLVLTGGIPIVVGVAALALIAVLEYANIFHHAGYHPVRWVGILFAPAVVVSAYFGFPIFTQVLTLLILLGILGFGIYALFQKPAGEGEKSDLFNNAAYTLFGAVYTGAFMAHTVLLRNLPDGANLLLLVVFGVAANDTFAYLVGKGVGRNPFFKHISPNKTREGALGGLIASTLAVGLLGLLLAVDLSIFSLFVFGILIGVAAAVGDLIESWFKRRASLKDSGSWIPEQGGLLDVIDGFMIAVVVAYYFLRMISLI